VEGGEDRRGQAEVEGEGDHETVPAPLPLEAELEAVVRHRAKESRERREGRAQKRSLLPYGMLRPKPDAPSRDGSGPEELDREGERARGKEERWKEERLRQMGRDLLDEVAEGSRYTPLRVIACRYVAYSCFSILTGGGGGGGGPKDTKDNLLRRYVCRYCFIPMTYICHSDIHRHWATRWTK